MAHESEATSVGARCSPATGPGPHSTLRDGNLHNAFYIHNQQVFQALKRTLLQALFTKLVLLTIVLLV